MRGLILKLPARNVAVFEVCGYFVDPSGRRGATFIDDRGRQWGVALEDLVIE